MGWSIPSNPDHSPDLAFSNYHLFGCVKDSLCGCHFAEDNELKKRFFDVLQSQVREFYNAGIQHLTQCWEKCVENDRDFVEK
jgi:histone-lysine N-methyltransferase SETMAR